MNPPGGGWPDFFRPRTVCVVGATSDPRRIGGRLVRYSLEAGFDGRIVPVNPSRQRVFDLPVAPSLEAVGESPDVVVIAVPHDQVEAVASDAVAVGARWVVVVAAGFAELGEEGRAAQERITKIVRGGGARLLGPNTNGFMHVHERAFFAFTPVLDSARPDPGDVAIVTQSAAVGTYLINWASTVGLGLSHWIHTGNEADVTALEAVEQVIRHGRTRAIALSFELLRDADRLRGTLALAATMETPVGVLRAGLSPAGRRAAHAHTAALVEDDAGLLADLLADAGVHVADSVRSLMGFLHLAVNRRDLPRRPRLGFVTTSGGVGVLMADAAERHGVELPTFSADLQRRLRGVAPFCHPANPVDTTAQVINEPERFQALLGACVDSGELDVLAAFIAHGLAGPDDITLQQVRHTAREAGRAGTAIVGLGLLTPEAARALQLAGVTSFREPADLAASVAAVAGAASARQRFAAHPAPATARSRTADLTRTLDEVAAKALLARLGVQIPDGRAVVGEDDAVVAARSLGSPVVLKLVSSALPHKAAAGAVLVSLVSDDDVRQAFRRLSRIREELGLDDAAILVEREFRGVEAFVGCIRHREHGPLVAIGAGGTDVETAGRVTWFWAPVDADGVSSALARHLPESHVEPHHGEAVASLARAMLELVEVHPEPVLVVECNPVILGADGEVAAVDALIELEGAPTDGTTRPLDFRRGPA